MRFSSIRSPGITDISARQRFAAMPPSLRCLRPLPGQASREASCAPASSRCRAAQLGVHRGPRRTADAGSARSSPIGTPDSARRHEPASFRQQTAPTAVRAPTDHLPTVGPHPRPAEPIRVTQQNRGCEPPENTTSTIMLIYNSQYFRLFPPNSLQFYASDTRLTHKSIVSILCLSTNLFNFLTNIDN